jgi:enhancing lycopene biosynthesis protein 2
VEFGTYFVKSAQHCPILASHPLLKEEICTILKKMRNTGQPLYAVCIQPLIKAIIFDKAPHIFEGTHSTAFKISYE